MWRVPAASAGDGVDGGGVGPGAELGDDLVRLGDGREGNADGLRDHVVAGNVDASLGLLDVRVGPALLRGRSLGRLS